MENPWIKTGGLSPWSRIRRRTGGGYTGEIVVCMFVRLDSMFIINNIETIKANMEADVPYREKLAWLGLGAMLVSYAVYFAVAYSGSIEGLPNLRLLAVYAGASFLQLAILGTGWLVLRRTSGKEARARPDEMDRAIGNRAGAVAYPVMMAGLVVTGVLLPFTRVGWEIVHAALLSFIIAEVVRYGVVVSSYRRGWRG